MSDREQKTYTHKYTREQYQLAELMLTSESFSLLEIARVCRLPVRLISKLKAGELAISIGLFDEEDE